MFRTLVPLLAVAGPLLAQESRSWIEVRPEGVFARDSVRPTQSPAPAANPNPSRPGLRWSYLNPPSTPWISQSVSVGNNGTFAFLGQHLNGPRLSFLSTTESSAPPAYVWEAPIAALGLYTRAADRGDGCAVGLVISNAGPHELRYFKSGSATPAFTAAIPVIVNGSSLETAISADGRWVTAAYNDPANVATVAVYDAQSATPATPVTTLQALSHQIREHDLSGDGKVVLLATHTQDHVIDVATGAQLFATSTVSIDAHTIDYDGDAFGRGGFDVGAWVRSGSTWNRVLNFRDSTLSFGIYTACDVSADGSTFAVAATDANNGYLPFRVYCWRLSATSATLLWTYSIQGAGQYQDTPQAVSVSDDGRWIAVGSWGVADNAHPEALLFDRDAGNVPVQVLDTPGSVFDVDLSGDGQFWVIGTKAVHANALGNGGEGYSFDRGGQGHRLLGTPSLGRSITLDTGGNPGEQLFLITGLKIGAPLQIPGVNGSLSIDLSAPYVDPVLLGTIPAGGVHSYTATVPNNPWFLRYTVYTQPFRVGMSGIEFDNWIALPFTP